MSAAIEPLAAGSRAGTQTSYETRDLTKTFSGVLAVDRVSLQVEQGEIHGIIGKNGAGKTVLMSLIAGLFPAAGGALQVGDDAVDVKHHTPARARALGIALIPQEPLFANGLSVLENVFMGRLPRKGRFVDFRSARLALSELAERLKITVSPGQAMNTVLIEDQQMLALGRALFVDRARMLLLDEITASLPQARKQLLREVLRQAIADRPEISVTLITHHIDEVLEFCDRVTVMRDGRAVRTIVVPTTTKHILAAWIVGNENQVDSGHRPDVAAAGRAAGAESLSAAVDAKPPAAAARTVLSATSLALDALEALSFELHLGEVLGIAGLGGSGKDEVFSIVSGVRRPDRGTLTVDGKVVRLRTPLSARRAGIAYLPKKRDQYAILTGRSVQENALTMVYPSISRLGVISGSRARALAQSGVKTLSIKTPSLSTRIDALSGGNRQKTMVARVLSAKPLIYLLNEPTRGVDLATKPELLSAIRVRLAERAGVILTSESPDELVEICDRVIVLYRGKVVGDLMRGSAGFDAANIYQLGQGVGL